MAGVMAGIGTLGRSQSEANEGAGILIPAFLIMAVLAFVTTRPDVIAPWELYEIEGRQRGGGEIMPTIITGTPAGLVWQDPDGAAKVGRWCKAPEVPDLCDNCYDPVTLAHYPAEGYRETSDGWRYGTCHRCEGRAEHERRDFHSGGAGGGGDGWKRPGYVQATE